MRKALEFLATHKDVAMVRFMRTSNFSNGFIFNINLNW